jgi:hypothetical protein
LFSLFFLLASSLIYAFSPVMIAEAFNSGTPITLFEKRKFIKERHDSNRRDEYKKQLEGRHGYP